MSNSVLTAAGAALITSCQLNQQVLNIDRVIFADIPGLDTAVPPPANTVMPEEESIVHQCAVSRSGLVNDSSVVYSAVLDSELGDFYINWMGLYCSEHDVLVAVCVMPRHRKYATGAFTVGNSLVKNFALQISDIANLTGISVSADTWQIDFTARLTQIDERERSSNFDIYGTKYFFDNAFLIINNGGSYELQPGVGYVDGIRVELDAIQPLGDVGTLPKLIYIDACLNGDISGVEALWTPQISNAELAHYVDVANQQHYLELIAVINADGSVTDRRDDGIGGTIRNINAAMAAHLANINPHPQYMTAANAAIATKLCQGRLTLTSGVPDPADDVTGAETLYFTPYQGNMIALHDGNKWKLYTFNELSLDLSGLLSNTIYDVFIYDDEGLTMEPVAWTDDTTRAVEIAVMDGIHIKSGDSRKRHLGTIMTTATVGQCADNHVNRLVWNRYNRVYKTVKAENSTGSWTYSSPIWREYNNGVGMVRGNFVLGEASTVELSLSALTQSTAINSCYAFTTIDSDRNKIVYGYVFNNSGMLGNIYFDKDSRISAGKHYTTMLEYASASMITVYGSGYPGRVTILM